jgi:hypothetical protein
VSYRGFEDPGTILAELGDLYEAFAYAPRAENPPDHIAVEAGFAGFLWLKEAYALDCGDEQAVEVTRSARRAFGSRHLAPFAAALAARLEDAPVAHLAAAARLVAEHAERLSHDET